ncbi:FecR family protein [Tahibacter amnicola]|uniref:FecR domain-containing protein n=1 Tax=Tahibacter amnicola TaxID=2976241 RepID=A0ABY6BN83_9GAMM|nr:FecR domain-containing protein [Tahibacter amnicola]UXI70520.1 FecR domain-containing protein [Tahibacter amnicola]
MKSSINVIDTDVPASAEAWVARLASPEWTDSDRAAFEAWYDASPANQNDFLAAQQLHISALQLTDDPMLAAAAKAALRKGPAGQLEEGGPRGRLGLWAGIAAALAVVAVTTALKWRGTDPGTLYQTAIGEQREIKLEDGSRVMLDTNSAIRVRYTSDRRELTVDHGRVDIDVAPKPGQPFVTYAANGTIRDIGTRFQVTFTANKVTVTLLQGIVSIATDGSTAEPTVIQAGSQASFDLTGTIRTAQATDIDAAQAWTRGELVFNRRQLADLVAEMNRYSTTQIRLADHSLDAIVVSGVFHAGDQSALVKALEAGWPLRAERPSEREIVLHPAPKR